MPLIDPESADGIARVQASGAALAVVSWWGLLPPAILALFPMGLINVHPSPLPKCRGALPTLWTLKNKDRSSAVSFLKIDAGMDTGPLLDVVNFEVAKEDDWKSLEDKVAAIVAQHLPRVLADYLAGALRPMAQEPREGSVTGSYRSYQRLQPAGETAAEAHNKIGLYPWFDPHETCHFPTPQGPVPVSGCEWAAGGGCPGTASRRRGWVTVHFLDGALRFRIGRHLSTEAAEHLLRALASPMEPNKGHASVSQTPGDRDMGR